MEEATVIKPLAKPRFQYHHAEEVPVPKDYFLGPFFAACKQSGPREVTIGGKRYLVGGFHPLRQDYSPPALDVRHGRAIFTLLSFWEPYGNSRRISFSLNEFCRRYANSNGGRYFRDIRQILGELIDSYIRVTDIKTGEFHQYRLIDYLDIKGKVIKRRDNSLATNNQTEMWFHGCDLSEEFFGLLGRVAELQLLKLKVFTSIRSPLAQAIYMYIPSRAYHHTESKPFEINLTNLLEQVSFRTPRQRQRRYQIFTQHAKEGRSLIQQLDGLETMSGKFRVRLAETKDGLDYKFQAWLERNPEKPKLDPSKSKLVQRYLESGRPREMLENALENVQPLNPYEIELLEAGKVEYPKNRRFFEWAKAILRESKFRELLSEAKADELEGRKPTKSQTARLIFRISEAVGAPISPTQPPRRPNR